MPKISSKDATFRAAQNLIYAIQNPSPSIPLVKLVNGHKDVLRTLAEILIKSISPAIPLRVPVREGVQEKIKEVNQEKSQMKSLS